MGNVWRATRIRSTATRHLHVHAAQSRTNSAGLPARLAFDQPCYPAFPVKMANPPHPPMERHPSIFTLPAHPAFGFGFGSSSRHAPSHPSPCPSRPHAPRAGLPAVAHQAREAPQRVHVLLEPRGGGGVAGVAASNHKHLVTRAHARVRRSIAWAARMCRFCCMCFPGTNSYRHAGARALQHGGAACAQAQGGGSGSLRTPCPLTLCRPPRSIQGSARRGQGAAPSAWLALRWAQVPKYWLAQTLLCSLSLLTTQALVLLKLEGNTAPPAAISHSHLRN